MGRIKPAISYVPRSDVTPEGELNALAAVYRFIFDCKAKKEDSPSLAALDDDGTKVQEDSASEFILPQ